MDEGFDWPDEPDADPAPGDDERHGGVLRPPLETDIDPSADGCRHGFATLPGEANTLDRRRVPLSVLRRGAGPRVLLVGGADGERSGSLALHRLARELDTDALDGTVAIVPEVPRDAFPALVGSLVDALADTPTETRADAVASGTGQVMLIELVGAPSGFGFSPMAALATGGATRADTTARAEAAMFAFGAAESVRFTAGPVIGTAADGTFARDVPHVVATLGGGVSPAEALETALVGCRNVLSALGVLDLPLVLRSTRPLAIRSDDAVVHAPTSGLLELRVRPGQSVHRGAPLALVLDPTRAGVEPVLVAVPRDGVVLGARTDARVRAGDAVAVIADETAL